MKNFATRLVIIFGLFGLVYQDIYACTTFCLKSKNETLFGKNQDWIVSDGLIFVNKSGVQKISTTEDEGNPVKWISKFGNITFNQYGRENPMGGMNEKGLVVELMWLDETVYPKPDKLPSIDELEWIQYQLDTAESTEEAVRSASQMRVNSDIKVHYLVNDAGGNTAAVEYINGQLVIHTGKDLDVPVLTNDTFDNSIKYFRSTQPAKAATDGSLDRFYRTAAKVRNFEARPVTAKAAVDYAFDTLSDVKQQGYTSRDSKSVWSTVYDQKRGLIYFRTLQNQAVRTINTKDFDYACSMPVKSFDINTNYAGDITSKFIDYTRNANRDLIEKTFNGTPFLKAIPKYYRDLAASYPEEFACTIK